VACGSAAGLVAKHSNTRDELKTLLSEINQVEQHAGSRSLNVKLTGMGIPLDGFSVSQPNFTILIILILLVKFEKIQQRIEITTHEYMEVPENKINQLPGCVTHLQDKFANSRWLMKFCNKQE